MSTFFCNANGRKVMEDGAKANSESIFWHGFGLILPLSVIYGNIFSGIWTLAGIVLALGLYPLIDLLSPHTTPVRSGGESPQKWLILLNIHVFLQTIAVVTLLWRAHEDQFAWTTFCAALSTAMNSGISGIVNAHELGHRKKGTFMWWLARLNLYTVLYSHFTTEHNHGHHRHYATDLDPVSAPKGRGLWTHILQAIPRQLFSALKVHDDRGRKGMQNPVLRGYLIQILMLISLWWFLGYWVLLAFVIQASIAIFLLEYVNYIQHYGLRREIGEKHTYLHSWESRSVWSRWTLLELPLHPAHHLKASLPLWELEGYEKAPQMPSGYFALFWPCMIPPIWRRLMDNRIPQES